MKWIKTTLFSQYTNQVDRKMNHKQTVLSTLHLWVTLKGSKFICLCIYAPKKNKQKNPSSIWNHSEHWNRPSVKTHIIWIICSDNSRGAVKVHSMAKCMWTPLRSFEFRGFSYTHCHQMYKIKHIAMQFQYTNIGSKMDHTKELSNLKCVSLRMPPFLQVSSWKFCPTRSAPGSA